MDTQFPSDKGLFVDTQGHLLPLPAKGRYTTAAYVDGSLAGPERDVDMWRMHCHEPVRSQHSPHHGPPGGQGNPIVEVWKALTGARFIQLSRHLDAQRHHAYTHLVASVYHRHNK